MSASLSDIELYYAHSGADANNCILLHDDEAKHCARVMRHKPGDKVYCTDGKGTVYTTQFIEAGTHTVTLSLQKKETSPNRFQGITAVVPVLKSPDRMEYALEKCTELGVTRYLMYTADHSVAKGMKKERWEKIVLAAMKQSLQVYLPVISTAGKLKDVLRMARDEGAVSVYFHQHAEVALKEYSIHTPHYLIFGPEGGFSENELSLLDECTGIRLTTNRLRAETAITSVIAAIVLK